MSSLEFVTFIEKNHKENETFIFFLQWTGNEAELRLLERATKEALLDDMSGDYVEVHLDTSARLCEATVDQMCCVKDTNNYNRMFTKCTGTFKCPLTEEEIETEDEYLLARTLDESFYSCKIEKMFSNYRNYYAELLQGKITREQYEELTKSK
jgi:hypothetical protein